MTMLYEFEGQRVWGLTEGEHSAPVLTPSFITGINLTQINNPLATGIYFYRGAHGQIAGPGLFGELPEELWPNERTPLFTLLDPDLDFDYQ